MDHFVPPQSDVIPQSPSTPEFSTQDGAPAFSRSTMFGDDDDSYNDGASGDGVTKEQQNSTDDIFASSSLSSSQTTTSGTTETEVVTSATDVTAVSKTSVDDEATIEASTSRTRTISSSASSPADLCSSGDASAAAGAEVESLTTSTTAATNNSGVVNENEVTSLSSGVGDVTSSTTAKLTVDCEADATATATATTSTTAKDPPTRVVIGRQQEPEVPAHLFRFMPCERDGRDVGAHSEYLPESGHGCGDAEEAVLDLQDIRYLALDWKNNDKARPYVMLQSKELVSIGVAVCDAAVKRACGCWRDVLLTLYMLPHCNHCVLQKRCCM